MKIGIYDPYLDTLGGGERYVLSIAACLQSPHKVSLFWNDLSILVKAERQFGLKLDRVKVVKNIFSPKTGTTERVIDSTYYDAIFYISDGSIPYLLAKKLFPILQYPIPGISSIDFATKLKLLNAPTILCYSNFIKSYIEKVYDRPITVLYPPVRIAEMNVARENIILSVGRFTRGKNEKKQDLMIDFFMRHAKHFSGWKLVLIGSVLPDDQAFVDELKKKTSDVTSIEIITDASFSSLTRHFAKAKIYLHAAGFGENVKEHPELAEHFGITVVEAMAQGTVPVVFDGGGPAEIVFDGVNGYVYRTEDELFHKLKTLMTDATEWQKLSEEAVKRADDFSEKAFCEQLKLLL